VAGGQQPSAAGVSQKNPHLFECETCHKNFSTKWHLVRHRDTVHGPQPEEGVEEESSVDSNPGLETIGCEICGKGKTF
jgi:hypothetical protein